LKDPHCTKHGARPLLICIAATLTLASGCGSDIILAPTLTVTPSQVTIFPGQQNLAVSVAAKFDKHSGPVVVTMTGLPSGITAAPLTLASEGSGTLHLSASLSAGQEGFPTTGVSSNTSWTADATVVAKAGSTKLTVPLPLTVSISNPSFAPAVAAINLPILSINTNGTPIVSKTTDVSGTVEITSADGQTTYLSDSASFHVHGTSTAGMPKLPYEMKLADSIDLLGTMGLQCPYVTSSGKAICDKSKKYVLLANYDDKTLLRDWSASALANAISYGGGYLDETPVPSGNSGSIPTPSGTSAHMPWAPHSLFVELYLNGAYEGNYQLIEHVTVDSHRVNINELSESDTSSSKVTGGYLMEIDSHQDEAYVFHTPGGLPIGLIDPDFSPDPEVPEQTSYITSYVDSAENALFSGSYTDPQLGWRAYFDEASAINFYIVNDVMGNVDGGIFYSSDYLYKDQKNPYLYMGPIWDFDISSGNVNYKPIVNPTVPWMQTQSPWYARWFSDPGFRADAVQQWNALQKKGIFTNWLASIRAQAASLEQSQANNFARWPMLGLEVWPNPEAVGTYDGEVNYLVNWLNLRIAYLDSIFNNKAQTSITLTLPSGALTAAAPVTLTADVTGGNGSFTGTVSFLSNGVPLGTANLAGSSSTLELVLPAGSDNLQAVYSGDANNAMSLSTSVSLTVAASSSVRSKASF